jgi:MFS family permease
MINESDNSNRSPIARVFSLRDFRLLLAGTATSILGDQFYLIATPWLVLQMTHDPLALGVIIALGGIPRAVLMLLGGAVTDRFSPRRILIGADAARMAITALMAAAVFTGTVQTWMLYAVSLAFGIVAGFAIPAGNSIVPTLVAESDLHAGNSVILGSTQLAGFVGPTLAGLMIGTLADTTSGIASAFAIDAVTFGVSAAALLGMHTRWTRRRASGDGRPAGILASIVDGMRSMWNDPALRLMFLVAAALNFLFIGPVMVGVPVLADRNLPEGAVAFGLLVSGFAGGNLAGYLLAAQLPRPGEKVVRFILIGGLIGFGVAIGSLGFLRSTTVLVLLMALLGFGNGYITIIVLTWIQSRTPREMLGRMMSMVMLTNTGLSPISQAIAGAAMTWSISGMFVATGVGLVLVPLWAARQPALRTVSEGLAGEGPGSGKLKI